MAVGVVMEFKGVTLEQYDQVLDRMGNDREGEGPPGVIFHWVTETEDGLRVTDVWESREVFERFAQATLGPLTQEVGVPHPPQITFHDAYNYMTAGARVAA